jgi:hypothetical protein
MPARGDVCDPREELTHMHRLFGLPRRHIVAVAVVTGGLAGAVVALVINRIDSGDRLVWWAPAGTVVAVFAGVMLGLLFGEEIKGGREDAIADVEAEAASRASSPDH